ncbi:terminal hydrolase isozyme L3 [Seminavis robusta]|uniref:Ubiquitin carboxyl-terminal hydrolase n=1 Tax=Seminavis robusta TaxID=568900 RepID=A0A9N8DE09_9STRA|nr:terminal hydrolase isozyme L3 [Seminavis robusta]|eukprot:Sro45_g027060.1 terminal hydrolase isozyme L3 (300) ;mRNA; r:101379-102629
MSRRSKKSRGREPEVDDGDDPLAVINAGLREQEEEEEDPDSPWLPLESNPEIFTDFAHKSGGLPKNWGWVDILGLDPELLGMVPEPCAGVILLFPCTENIYKVRKQEKQKLLHNPPTPATQKAYHVQQIAEFGNACGTIASVHALINGASVYSGNSHTSPLQKFRQGHENASALDRGKALLATESLRNSSDQSANHRAAQTAVPDRYGPDLDHHFVAFSPISTSSNSTHVVELDGTKVLPVDHGSVTKLLAREERDSTVGDDPKKHTFLRAVAQVIRKRYMQVEPDSIEFSMMALCRIK